MPIDSPQRARFFDAVIIIVMAVGSLYMIARVALQPRHPADGVAVVFAPWTNGASALVHAVSAGARFVRYGKRPFIVVVVPDVADYESRAFGEGALLVVDPQALSACLSVLP
ncbi:MAG TPA: hypothetical protein VKV77_08475 [Methylovirgula sp.]|nr:hypothetical protein [Methylovirgula sp.]